ncbi:MAG: ABC transporter ATP-binding protein [Candidatus Eiseniibacteriota bacterium]|jgi:ABC-type lipoprotein export system ATPase subunit
MDVIRLEQIDRVFEEGGATVPALRGVNLAIPAGQMVALVGSSGSGKSTLLHLIGAMDVPTAGRLWFEGRDLAALSDAGRTEVRGRRVGFVFQFFHLLPTLDLLENVMLPALIAGEPERAVKPRAARLLDEVGLGSFAARRVTGLSGGERQRGAIARALIHDPPVVLADEPTGGLDSQNGQVIIDTLRALPAARGTTVVLATHAAELARVADRTIELHDGRVVRDGD